MSQANKSLCNDLKIVLAEAAFRGNSLDAAVVISGSLNALSDSYPELQEIAKEWQELASHDLAAARPFTNACVGAELEGVTS